ncbi:MAG TPA: phosphatase PAP2 family protein [Solirubrobacteraceae bacterium]|nr:phosphatase PAP2 family protein [Solirubrobacteraceae bacterium]
MPLAHTAGSAAFYWAIAAELLLVVWTGLLFLAPRWSGPGSDRWHFRLSALGAALLAALITLAGKTLEVWPGHPLFPSGHTAFAVAVAVSLVARDRRWLGAVVPLAGLQAVALVLGDYHVPVDVVGGAGVGLAVGAGLWAWLQRARARRIATS